MEGPPHGFIGYILAVKHLPGVMTKVRFCQVVVVMTDAVKLKLGLHGRQNQFNDVNFKGHGRRQHIITFAYHNDHAGICSLFTEFANFWGKQKVLGFKLGGRCCFITSEDSMGNNTLISYQFHNHNWCVTLSSSWPT